MGVLGTVILLFVRSSKFSLPENDLMPESYWKELWELKDKSLEKFKHVLEVSFEIVLVIGLALELIALPQHFVESAKLNKEAQSFRLKAAQLEAKIQPRTITTTRAANFIELTKGIQFKYAIFICLGHQVDNETYNFAQQINELLILSGFDQYPFPQSAVVKTNLYLKRQISDDSINNFDLWIFDGNSHYTDKDQGTFLDISKTNHPELFDGSEREHYASVAEAFQKIGISVVWEKTTNKMFNGDILLYIPPKNY